MGTRRRHVKNQSESPIEWQLAMEMDNHLLEPTPQYQIGEYYADFAFPEEKLVIECDGHKYHKTKQQRTYCARRARFMQRQGWTVYVFTGSEIFTDVEKCVFEIRQMLKILRENHGQRK